MRQFFLQSLKTISILFLLLGGDSYDNDPAPGRAQDQGHELQAGRVQGQSQRGSAVVWFIGSAFSADKRLRSLWQYV